MIFISKREGLKYYQDVNFPNIVYCWHKEVKGLKELTHEEVKQMLDDGYLCSSLEDYKEK